MIIFGKRLKLVTPDRALPGRDEPISSPGVNFALGTPIKPPFPEGTEVAYFGMGCFWGAERIFWRTPGVYTTAAGYAGGYTPNPTYDEVCSGYTNHAEVVLVAYDPNQVSFDDLLARFWEEHDPTQGMRQGNDVGTQYRSAIYWTTEAQREAAEETRSAYQHRLTEAGHKEITTEIAAAGEFYYAEHHHQQYLGKNPNGYCGLEGTGVSCPAGLEVPQARTDTA